MNKKLLISVALLNPHWFRAWRTSLESLLYQKFWWIRFA